MNKKSRLIASLVFWVISIILAIIFAMNLNIDAVIILAIANIIGCVLIMDVPDCFGPYKDIEYIPYKNKKRFIRSVINAVVFLITVTLYVGDITSYDNKYVSNELDICCESLNPEELGFEFIDMMSLASNTRLLPTAVKFPIAFGVRTVDGATQTANVLTDIVKLKEAEKDYTQYKVDIKFNIQEYHGSNERLIAYSNLEEVYEEGLQKVISEHSDCSEIIEHTDFIAEDIEDWLLVWMFLAILLRHTASSALELFVRIIAAKRMGVKLYKEC